MTGVIRFAHSRCPRPCMPYVSRSMRGELENILRGRGKGKVPGGGGGGGTQVPDGYPLSNSHAERKQ